MILLDKGWKTGYESTGDILGDICLLGLGKNQKVLESLPLLDRVGPLCLEVWTEHQQRGERH
jgi:hypothetical protein